MKTGRSANRNSNSALWQRPATRIGALAAVACVASVGAYVAVAWIAVPRILADAVAAHVAAVPGRELAFERLAFNPFTLGVELDNVHGVEPRAPIVFDAARVELDLDVATLFARRLVVTAFDVERAELRVPEPQGASRPERVVADIAVSVRALERNGLAGGRYRVRIGDFAGARVELAGEIGNGASASAGQIELAGLDLARLEPWVPTLEPLAPRGQLDLDAEYRWPVRADRFSLEIERGAATLSNLELTLATNLGVRADSLAALASASVAARGATLDGNLRLELADAHLEIVDSHVAPPIRYVIEQTTGTVAAASAPTEEIDVDVEGELAGDRPSSTRLAAMIGDGELALAFTATDVAATTLSPYALAALDRALVAGRVDLDLAYTARAGRSLGELGLRTLGLELGASAGANSLEFAQALLEDEHGALSLEVPLSRDTGSNAVPALSIAAGVRERIDAIVAMPLETVASLVGADATTLGSVPFEPGIAAVAASGDAALDTLAEALRVRPRLGLLALGGFDPQADRDALARQQVELHVTLATAGPTLRARPEPIDFGSARAQDVLDEFAGERLAAELIAEIAARFPGARALASTAPNRIEYYQALFDALVAHEAIGASALRRIGRYRAQAIREALSARGIGERRIATGDGAAAAAWDEASDAVRVRVELALPTPAGAAPSDPTAEGARR